MHTLQVTGDLTQSQAIDAINGRLHGYHVMKTAIHGSNEFRAVVFDSAGRVVAIANVFGE